MIYHYCRVSSRDQNLDRQLKALSACKPADRVFTDKQSGKDFDRPAYQELKRTVNPGDEVLVKELDRLGRNKEETKRELQWFSSHGVTVRILNIPTSLIDFGTQEWVRDMVNNIIIEVLSSVAQEEREKIRQRQREGIDAMPTQNGKRVSAKSGAAYGRPAATISTHPQFPSLYAANRRGEISVTEACERLGICRATWYKLANGMEEAA